MANNPKKIEIRKLLEEFEAALFEMNGAEARASFARKRLERLGIDPDKPPRWYVDGKKTPEIVPQINDYL